MEKDRDRDRNKYKERKIRSFDVQSRAELQALIAPQKTVRISLSFFGPDLLSTLREE